MKLFSTLGADFLTVRDNGGGIPHDAASRTLAMVRTAAARGVDVADVLVGARLTVARLRRWTGGGSPGHWRGKPAGTI